MKKMKVTRKSQVSGEIHTMELDITKEQMDRFEQGKEHIQDIFPSLPAPEREFILTGITPLEWNTIFGKECDDE